jgi:hypothetical protein
MNYLARVVPARAGEHFRAAPRLVHADLDDAPALVCGKRRRLASRAAGHEEVHAGIDLPSRQRPHARLIERAGRGERRDECGADAREVRSHMRESPFSCHMHLVMW